MLKYSIKRIILALITAFIILSLTFLLVKSLGLATTTFQGKESAKYAYYVKQANLNYVFMSPVELPELGEPLASFNVAGGTGHEYYYPVPILEQYGNWLRNVFTKWDWGVSTSIDLGQPATTIIFSRLPTSMYINIIAVIVSVPLGIACWR